MRLTQAKELSLRVHMCAKMKISPAKAHGSARRSVIPGVSQPGARGSVERKSPHMGKLKKASFRVMS